MYYTQAGTKPGHRPFVGAAGLIGFEGRLVVLSSNSGVPTVAVPTATTQIPAFLLVDDGAPSAASGQADPGGQVVECQPLDPNEQIRITGYGTGTAGCQLVMADPTANAGAQAGMVVKLPTVAGVYVQVGFAEEDFVAGQLVKIRPALQLVVVAATLVAAPAALTSTQNATTAAVDLGTSEALANALKANYNALQADVAALQAKLTALMAALVVNGQIKEA